MEGKEVKEMRYKSYAQELEDIILYFVLKDVEKIFWIDVGANDPIDISVTNFFSLRGGKGINIEPLRSMCLLLEEERPRDINLCVGVGKEMGYMDLVACGTGSTFDAVVSSKMENSGELRRHNKRMVTLQYIFQKYVKKEQEVHFCKIDVEGYEKEVLEGISDWYECRPWIYVMESAEPGTTIPCYDKWENMLLDNGYLFAYEHGINRYYVDECKEHLIERFKMVDDFINESYIVKMKMEKI